MANVKISNLTAASTPLAGTEVLPIVQSGATVKASIANVQTATYSGGTANGVAYLNGSKVLTTGSGLTYDGTTFATTGNTTLGDASTDTLNVGNGGLIKDANGNVGVGVTPSAWKSNYKASQVGNATAVVGRTDSNNNYFSSNWYINSSNQDIYQNTGFATIYTQGAGTHAWYTAASGTAGNAITFTQAMTLDASGNLLVGTTSVTGKKVAAVIGNSSSDSVLYGGSGSTYSGTIIEGVSATAASTSWLFFVGKASTTSATVYIFGNGNIQNTNNSYGAISDIKLKENIVDATPKLADLMQVKVRNYNLKGDYEQHKQIGVVAQELEQIFPSMIDESSDKDEEGNDLGTTTKSVKYSVFVPMLIKAIQEQQALIQTLTDRITALEAR